MKQHIRELIGLRGLRFAPARRPAQRLGRTGCLRPADPLSPETARGDRPFRETPPAASPNLPASAEISHRLTRARPPERSFLSVLEMASRISIHQVQQLLDCSVEEASKSRNEFFRFIECFGGAKMWHNEVDAWMDFQNERAKNPAAWT